MTMREERKKRWESLKGRPLQEKMEYIKEYFGLQILAVLCVLVLVVTLCVKIATEKDVALSIACINATPYGDSQKFQQTISKAAGIDLSKSEIKISTDLICDQGDVQKNYYSMQRLIAQLTAGELDALASDEDAIASYMYQDAFQDLSQVLDVQALEENLLYADMAVVEQLRENSEAVPSVPDPTKPELMERPVPMAVKIPGDSAFVQQYFYYYSGDIYLGLVVNANNTDNVLALINYLYD